VYSFWPWIAFANLDRAKFINYFSTKKDNLNLNTNKFKKRKCLKSANKAGNKNKIVAANEDQRVIKFGVFTVLVHYSFSACSVLAQ